MSRSQAIRTAIVVSIICTVALMAQSVTQHIVAGPNLPARCSPGTGDIFFKTSATVGIYVCNTQNLWTNLLNSLQTNPGVYSLGSTFGATPATFGCPNDGTTGTTINGLVKLTSSNACITSTTGDATTVSTFYIGICVFNCSRNGIAQIVPIGQVVPCVFDNATTFGHRADASVSIASDCTDSGANGEWQAPYHDFGIILDSGPSGLHNVLLSGAERNPFNGGILINSSTRIDASAFAGQFRIEQGSGAAGTCIQIGGSGASNPALKDNGALLQIFGAGSSCGTANADADFSARNYVEQVGSNISSASTIAPVSPVTHITGTTQINTITAPAVFSVSGYGGCIDLIPDGAWSLGTSGNIAIAVQAVVSKPIKLCYDNGTTKWYPEQTYSFSYAWSCIGSVTANATLFIQPGTGAACTDTTANDGFQIVNAGGTVSTLYVIQTTASNQASGIVYTVMKTGAAQSMTCTVGNTQTTCNDTNAAHAFTVVAGDTLAIRAVTVTGETATGLHASVGISY
jgi:hypothetical protein